MHQKESLHSRCLPKCSHVDKRGGGFLVSHMMTGRERERCLLGHSIADTFELFGTVGNSYTIMKLWIYMRWNNYNLLYLIAGK
jgi:hypothetical protein